MAHVDPALHEFLERYPPHPYRLKEDVDAYPPTQLKPVTHDDGLVLLNGVPAAAPRGRPRGSRDEHGEHCHLWVIDARGRPCISEVPLPRLGDDLLHHTNLTGGGEASVGGEIWFDELPRIYLSGWSGRYPPCDPIHLEAAEDLFRAVGFDVVPLGWDYEADQPMPIWRDQGTVLNNDWAGCS